MALRSQGKICWDRSFVKIMRNYSLLLRVFLRRYLINGVCVCCLNAHVPYIFKVDVLVDKQRAEYMHAYEHHMIDVQRELHNLREKATAIANDTTREEKIKKLDSDQKWFRNEAMRLDVDTNVFRKKMRDIKVMIQSTGKILKTFLL